VGAAVTNNVSDALVIGGQSGLRKILMLENALQSRPLSPFRRIGPVTAVAIVVIDLPSGSLLGVQAKLSVGLATLHIATRKKHGRQACGQGQPNPMPMDSRWSRITLLFNCLDFLHPYRDRSMSAICAEFPTVARSCTTYRTRLTMI